MYTGIEHTAIASPDPEALASWYERTLHFPSTIAWARTYSSKPRTARCWKSSLQKESV